MILEILYLILIGLTTAWTTYFIVSCVRDNRRLKKIRNIESNCDPFKEYDERIKHQERKFFFVIGATLIAALIEYKKHKQDEKREEKTNDDERKTIPPIF